MGTQTSVNINGKLCVVQFLHPGGEHRPDHGDIKDWNRGNHQRKFMKVVGRSVRAGAACEGDLLFWGEWEPQSEVIARIDDPLRNGPRFIYRPFYSIPPSYRDLQNTDPFVFDGFFYTGCQQHTVKGPTQLRYLTVGSVVLFGSCVDRCEFALDTVFVVAGWVDHDRHSVQSQAYPRVPAGYRDVTLAPWYRSREAGCTPVDRSYRLYFGATYDAPVAGMFSYFPCIPATDDSRGFARPVIDLPGVVTGTCLQGKRLNPQSDAARVTLYWEQVQRQVESQECSLGISATMPPLEQCDVTTTQTRIRRGPGCS